MADAERAVTTLSKRARAKQSQLDGLGVEVNEAVMQRQQMVGMVCKVLGVDHDDELRLARARSSGPSASGAQAAAVARAAADAAHAWATASEAAHKPGVDDFDLDELFDAAAAARTVESEGSVTASAAMPLLPVAHVHTIVDRAIAQRRERTIEHRDRRARLKAEVARLGATHAREIERLENQLSFLNDRPLAADGASEVAGRADAADVDTDAETGDATACAEVDSEAEAGAVAQAEAVTELEARVAALRAKRAATTVASERAQRELLAELEHLTRDAATQAKARDSTSQKLKARTRELEEAQADVYQRDESLVRAHARFASARSRHALQKSAIETKASDSAAAIATAAAEREGAREALVATRAAGAALLTLRAQYAKAINGLDELRMVEATLTSQVGAAMRAVPGRKRALAQRTLQLDSAQSLSASLRERSRAATERAAVKSARQDEARASRTTLAAQRTDQRARLRETTARCIEAEVKMRQLEASVRQCSGVLDALEERIVALDAEEALLLEQRAAQERSATEHAARAASDAAQAECAVARCAALRRDAAASVTAHASVLQQMRVANAAKHALVASELERHDVEISALGKHVAELREDLDSGRAQQRQVVAMAKAQEAREAEMVRRVELVCIACVLLSPSRT